jgi:hypothetical protein
MMFGGEADFDGVKRGPSRGDLGAVLWFTGAHVAMACIAVIALHFL